MDNNENQRLEEAGRLDGLFREGLKDFRSEPSKQVWKGLSRKLLARELLRFNFTNLSRSLWIGGAAVVVITGATLFFALPLKKVTPHIPVPDTEQSRMQQSETTPPAGQASENTGQNKVIVSNEKEQVKSTPGKTEIPEAKNTPGNTRTSKHEPVFNSRQNRPAPVAASEGVVNPAEEKSRAPALAATRVRSKQESIEKSIATNQKVNEQITNSTPSDLDDKPLTVVPGTPDRENTEVLTMTSRKPQIFLAQPGPATMDSVGSAQLSGGKSEHQPRPQYFSLAIGVAPELSFYKTSASYTKVNYWLGLDFAWHFGKFYLKPGIGWGFLNDDGNYLVTYKRQDSIGFYYHITSYTIDPEDPGNITYNYTARTVYDSILHDGNEKASNRYQYFQVPLLLGFNLVETPRFSLAMQAGPGVSLLVSEKETHVETIQLSNSTLVERVNQTPARVTVNWQLWAGVHMEYRFKEMFSMIFEPTFKYYLAPVTDNAGTANPWVVGINVGLQYNFGYKNGKK